MHLHRPTSRNLLGARVPLLPYLAGVPVLAVTLVLGGLAIAATFGVGSLICGRGA